MLLDIDFHSGIPIYRQIVDQIRHLILSGVLPEGRQLDSVRDLSVRLKVNAMTISKAYSLLEAEGLVERRRGIGLFVAQMTDSAKNRQSHAILDEIMSKTAASIVQMGLDRSEAIELFTKHIDKSLEKAEKNHGK